MKTDNAILQSAPETIKTGNRTLVFREITQANELEEAFRFRYGVYSECNNAGFLKRNRFKVDIDVYDLHSKHYGLFSDENEIVGYFRLVFDRHEYYNSEVFKIGEKFSFFSEAIHSLTKIKKLNLPDFPFLSYPEVPDFIKSHYSFIISIKLRIVEAGRLIVNKNERGVAIVRLLCESAIANYLNLSNDYHFGIICCSLDHSIFYKRYGFKPFAKDKTYNLYGTTKISLCFNKFDIPACYHEKLIQMAAEFKITGEIRRTIS